MSARKAGNGFVAGRIVSSAAAGRNNCPKTLMISAGPTGDWSAGPAAVVHWPTSAISSRAGVGTGEPQWDGCKNPPVRSSVRLFNVSVVEKAPRQRDDLEPKSRRSRLTRMTCNLSERWRVVIQVSTKDRSRGQWQHRCWQWNLDSQTGRAADRSSQYRQDEAAGKLWRNVAAMRRQRQLLDAAKIRPVGRLPRAQGPVRTMGSSRSDQALVPGSPLSGPGQWMNSPHF